MNRFPLTLIFLLVFNACAVHHKSLSGIKEWSFPQNQFDNQFDFRYVDHVLEKTGNSRAAKWAERKNVHVLAIRLMNNSNKPVHGVQIAFFSGDEKVEIIHNNWLAKKVRQRVSPLLIFLLPAFLIEDAVFHKDEDHLDEFYRPSYQPEPNYITEDIANQAERKRQKANFDLRSELTNFQMARQILYPGSAVYGIIGIKCRGELQNLKVTANSAGFDVLLPAGGAEGK